MSKQQLTQRTKNELAELWLRLNALPIRYRLIEEQLKPKEIKLLLKERGGEVEDLADRVGTKQILHVVAEKRGWTVERAFVDLAQGIDAIGPGQYARLRGEIGEPVDSEDFQVPCWDADAGRLEFRGLLVRKVSPRADNVREILDRFERQNWPHWVPSPFYGAKRGRKLRETVRTMNAGLSAIRFYCDGTSDGVLWQEAR